MRIALTGGIASGKSLVAEMLRELGAVIIDSDVLAREVVEPGTPGLRAIVERFGEGILLPDGSLDRAGLGAIVFSDDRARADLNAIVHPLVREAAVAMEEWAPEGAPVVQVIPLLLEAGLARGFDAVVVVDVPEEVQLERLVARNGYTREEALARMAAQATRDERLAIATHVVDNALDPGRTRARVEELVGDLGWGSGGPATRDQVEDDEGHHDDQQQVDESADHIGDEADQPHG